MSALPFDIVETNRLTTFYQLVQLDTFHNLINVHSSKYHGLQSDTFPFLGSENHKE